MRKCYKEADWSEFEETVDIHETWKSFLEIYNKGLKINVLKIIWKDTRKKLLVQHK